MSEKYKNIYRIEPNRLQYWDYSAPADYFITIVTQNRDCIFGTIENGIMKLSKYGKIVKTEFFKINQYHKRAILDEYIIMPNHVHCIITLTDYDNDVEKIHGFSLQPSQQPQSAIKQYRKLRRNMVLIKILGKFKQQSSKQINILRNSPGTKNWQRDFYDHIIRNDISFQRIKNYIINNPLKWNNDNLYG
jgi:REP element-mobilizing transposase RayT